MLDIETMELWYGVGGLWSPDSTALASGSCCLGSGEGVTIIEVPSGTTTRVPVPGDVTSLVWAPDASSLALMSITPGVTSPSPDREVFVVNRDGTALRQVTNTDLLVDSYPEMLWTGSDFLLVRNRSGTEPANPQISYAHIDLSSGAVSELTTADPPQSGDPRLDFGEKSPNGRYIAYSDGPRLYVLQAPNGQSELVDERGSAPTWSPDGTKLLFHAQREGEGIPFWRMYDAQTGKATDLPEVGFWAQWTADGRLVHDDWRCPTGRNDDIGPRDVTVTDPETGASEVFTQTPEVPEPEGQVSPSAHKVAFFVAGDPYSLELVDLSSGVVETIATAGAPFEPFHVHRGNWSPDGRYLQFGYGSAHGICD